VVTKSEVPLVKYSQNLEPVASRDEYAKVRENPEKRKI
jgi:hypothetical protein